MRGKLIIGEIEIPISISVEALEKAISTYRNGCFVGTTGTVQFDGGWLSTTDSLRWKNDSGNWNVDGVWYVSPYRAFPQYDSMWMRIQEERIPQSYTFTVNLQKRHARIEEH